MRFIVGTDAGCVIIIPTGSATPTKGQLVFCHDHAVNEVLMGYERFGWWLQCGVKDCGLHAVYESSDSAMKRGRIHVHTPRFRVYEGTKLQRFGPYYKNSQDTLW